MTDRTLPLGVAGAGRDRSLLGRLNGPQTIGRGPAFWSGFVLAVLIAVAYPFFADGWTVGNTAYFFTWTFMAMGLCLIWGYTGALSFGQTAFLFGLSGYAYGILTINVGARLRLHLRPRWRSPSPCRRCWRACSATSCSMAGSSGVFLGIVTLSVTLVFRDLHGPDRRPRMARRRGPPETGSTA